MEYHLGMKFSTKDRDNDNSDDVHCAEMMKAGWWFNDCVEAVEGLRVNLNGPYGKVDADEIESKKEGFKTKDADLINKDIVWAPWLGDMKTLKYTEMKFRPFDRA